MRAFLEALFGDVKGAIGIIDEHGSIHDYQTAEEAANSIEESFEIDLVTSAHEVVAVVDHELNIDKATFYLETDDETLPVFVFEEPVHPKRIPADEAVSTVIPAPIGMWRVRAHTNEFYSVDTLYPMEEEDAPTHSAVPDDNAFLAASAGVNDDADDPDEHEILHDGPTEDQERSLSEDAKFLEEIVSKPTEPEYWFDAEVIGHIDDGLEAFLDRPAVFMTGNVYEADGARQDKRNTKAGHWHRAELPWRAWLEGGDSQGSAPEWGLLRHPTASEKGGPSIVLAETLEGERLKTAVDTLYAIGIDIDSGDDMDEVIDRITELGHFCILYTSFNHMKDKMRVKQATVMSKLRIRDDPTIDDIKRYLHDHQKGKFDANFISNIEIEKKHRDPREGIVFDLKTPPLQKFRLVFPLSEPVKLLDLGETIDSACNVWEEKVTGLAHKILNVHFDTSCTDVTRIFYTPRHPENGEWYSALIAGDPIDFDRIPRFKKSAYLKLREGDNAFSVAGSTDGSSDKRVDCFAPSGMSLNAWHTKFKERFMLADALETYCPDKLRETGAEGQGAVHTECPFEHLHTKSGGTATMAINALDSDSGYWTWFCHHDACQSRDKLEMLEQALADEWFDESVLLDEDYLAAGEDTDDEEEDEADEAPDDEDNDDIIDNEEEHTSYEDEAKAFDSKSSEKDIRNFIAKLRKKKVDMTVWNSIKGILAKNTLLGARDLGEIWKQQIKAEKAAVKAEKESDPSKFKGVPIIGESSDDFMCTYALRCLEEANREDPYLFRYMRSFVRIAEESQGSIFIEPMDINKFAHELNCVARFEKNMGENGKRTVFAPREVVNHLFGSQLTQFPELRGVITTPTFDREGNIINREGYHYKSQLYYSPDLSLSVPRFSEKPSDEEVYEAKRLLIEEVLGDFPLGGYSRKEIVELGLDGEGIPAVTNMIGLFLLPFVREMIDGPTPGHLLTKPVAGSGASLLTEVLHMVTLGNRGAASPFPSGRNSQHEIRQTLFSMFAAGKPIIWFDNINEGIDSGDLAAAMTASTYEARELGKSRVVPVDVRCAWVFTGNNVVMSTEMLRRLCMIDLDPQMEHPERRTGWRHKDIIGWVRKNRGKLVWACLTLAQRWIADGMPAPDTAPLASYENWTRVVGGILQNAGLGGFMENRRELKERASDDTDDLFKTLIQIWWDEKGQDPLTVATASGLDSETGIAPLATSQGIRFPGVRIHKEGTMEEHYDTRSFSAFLKQHAGRVFEIEKEGIQIKLVKTDKRSSVGYYWQLKPVEATQ